MTVATFDPKASLVKVTEAAKDHFNKMLANTPGEKIRLSTKVSGCSGYAYVLDSVAEAKEGDIFVELENGITLLVAADSIPLVRDTEIDYVITGINGEIRFNNPNVVNECGCGESFNIG